MRATEASPLASRVGRHLDELRQFLRGQKLTCFPGRLLFHHVAYRVEQQGTKVRYRHIEEAIVRAQIHVTPRRRVILILASCNRCDFRWLHLAWLDLLLSPYLVIGFAPQNVVLGTKQFS